MEFKYRGQIGQDHLRLLRPELITKECIRFRSSVVRRKSAPSYTAVSYTWGDAPTSEIVYVDGCKFRVRLNLWSCLYYLGQHMQSPRPEQLFFHPEFQYQYLWVDAICINQNSHAERTAQVRCMDETYRQATVVSVWLGLIPIPEEILSVTPPGKPIKTLETHGFPWEDSMADLANRPYWLRFWVVQEFSLAKDVSIHCSNVLIPLSWFRDILIDKAGLDHKQSLQRPYISAELASQYKALPLVLGRHTDIDPIPQRSLYDLISQHRNSECKDPRDRVFSLLGLVDERERGLLGRVFPNYSLPKEIVWVLTLAHLTQYWSAATIDAGLKKITASSDDIFLGLGLDDTGLRTKLLREAELIDWFGEVDVQEVIAIISHEIEFSTYDTFDPEPMDVEEEVWEYSEPMDIEEESRDHPGPGQSFGKLKIMSIVLGLLGVVWWFY